MESFITPPTSPDTSRLVTKRRCPFGESPQQCKVAATDEARDMYTSQSQAHVEEPEISPGYTFQLLMNSQKCQQRTPGHCQYLQSPLSTTTSFENCWVCQKASETMPCAFCEHSACEMCVRQCDKCLGVFCGFCSTINYDRRDDRPLCLTCNAEELRRSRGTQSAPAGLGQWNHKSSGLSQVMA